jgi:hypothetical protein
MLFELRQAFAGVETEIADDEIAFMTRRRIGAGCGQRGREQNG